MQPTEQLKRARCCRCARNSLLGRVDSARRLAAAVPREKGRKLVGAVCRHTHALRLQILQGAWDVQDLLVGQQHASVTREKKGLMPIGITAHHPKLFITLCRLSVEQQQRKQATQAAHVAGCQRPEPGRTCPKAATLTLTAACSPTWLRHRQRPLASCPAL